AASTHEFHVRRSWIWTSTGAGPVGFEPTIFGSPRHLWRRSPMSYPGFPHPYNPVIAVVIWTTVPLAVLVSSSRDKKPMDADLRRFCYVGFQAIPRRSVVTPVARVLKDPLE